MALAHVLASPYLEGVRTDPDPYPIYVELSFNALPPLVSS